MEIKARGKTIISTEIDIYQQNPKDQFSLQESNVTEKCETFGNFLPQLKFSILENVFPLQGKLAFTAFICASISEEYAKTCALPLAGNMCPLPSK